MSSASTFHGQASVASDALQHWLATPRDTRYGIDYGHRIHEWLYEPLIGLGPARAAETLQLLRSDIPIFSAGGVPVDLHVREIRGDKRVAVFELGGGVAVFTGTAVGAGGAAWR